MYDPYECPDCDAHRDSPRAICDRCGFDPNPAPATEAEVNAWEAANIPQGKRQAERQAAAGGR